MHCILPNCFPDRQSIWNVFTMRGISYFILLPNLLLGRMPVT
jgi:hypothetical protein